MYAPTYDVLKQSGLYQALTEAGQLVAQREVDVSLAATPDAYAVVQPEIIPFISYPYEWSFSQLKQAALLTLAIEEQALNFDLSLKDSSAYNIQFVGTRPVMIDTLSFEPYVEGKPWGGLPPILPALLGAASVDEQGGCALAAIAKSALANQQS